MTICIKMRPSVILTQVCNTAQAMLVEIRLTDHQRPATNQQRWLTLPSPSPSSSSSSSSRSLAVRVRLVAAARMLGHQVAADPMVPIQVAGKQLYGRLLTKQRSGQLYVGQQSGYSAWSRVPSTGRQLVDGGGGQLDRRTTAAPSSTAWHSLRTHPGSVQVAPISRLAPSWS